MSTDARAEIMGRVRAALGDRPAPSGLPRPPEAVPELGDLRSIDARVERFRERLASVGGVVEIVADEKSAADAVARLVREHGWDRVAVSDDVAARRMVAALGGVTSVPFDAPREELLSVPCGVSAAQWGIAETGTLVLESDAEHHRVVSLLPPLHVAVIDAAKIVASLGDALAAVHRGDAASLSRAITFITGPSRTADIELTLVVGVHGPKELHVIVVRGDTP